MSYRPSKQTHTSNSACLVLLRHGHETASQTCGTGRGEGPAAWGLVGLAGSLWPVTAILAWLARLRSMSILLELLGWWPAGLSARGMPETALIDNPRNYMHMHAGNRRPWGDRGSAVPQRTRRTAVPEPRKAGRFELFKGTVCCVLKSRFLVQGGIQKVTSCR